MTSSIAPLTAADSFLNVSIWALSIRAKPLTAKRRIQRQAFFITNSFRDSPRFGGFLEFLTSCKWCTFPGCRVRGASISILPEQAQTSYFLPNRVSSAPLVVHRWSADNRRVVQLPLPAPRPAAEPLARQSSEAEP